MYQRKSLGVIYLWVDDWGDGIVVVDDNVGDYILDVWVVVEFICQSVVVEGEVGGGGEVVGVG